MTYRFALCCAAFLGGLTAQEPEQLLQLRAHYPHNDLPALLDRMQSADAAKAQEAAEAVAKVGRPARPYLIGLMSSWPRRGAQAISIPLKGFDHQDAWAVPILMELLGRQFGFYKKEAVQLLGQLGSYARPAIPTLEACLVDPKQRYLHEDARRAITAIKTSTKENKAVGETAPRFTFPDDDVNWLVKTAAAGSNDSWPAIQALQAKGDAALIRMLPAMLEATAHADGERRQRLDQLRAMIRYEAATRMIYDATTLTALSAEDLERELTTISLAGAGGGYFTLGSWLRALIRGSDPRLRALALMAFAQSSHPHMDSTTRNVGSGQGSKDPIVRHQIRAALTLLRSNEKRKHQQMVARALKKLESGKPGDVERAISSLTIVGRDALPAADHVIKAYRHGDPKIQRTARLVLQQMGPKVAPKLLAAFDVKDPQDARKLIPVLGLLRPATREVVFAMLDCRSHADKGVQDVVARYSFHRAAAPYLCEALLDATRREAAIEYLYRRTDSSWRPELLKALPSLEAAARTVKGESQKQLLLVMAYCGPRVVPFLQQALASKDDEEQLAALGALRRLGTQGFRALDAVIACLKDENPKVQTQAIWALARIDTQNDKIVNAMVAAFDGAGADVRVSLLRAIGRKDPKAAAPAVPLLERLMQGKDLALRFHAAGVLGTLRPDDPRPVEICRNGLKDYKGDELWTVAHAIGIHTSVTRQLVPEMAALLKSDHAQVRMNTIIALRWLRGDAKAALPALRELAKTGTERERQSATHAIRRISAGR